MSEKLKNSKPKVRATQVKAKLTIFTALFFETVWAFGVSVAAAMAISTPAFAKSLSGLV